MEAAVPSDFEEKKMPLLNCKIWMENKNNCQQIRYEHYEKPMASEVTIQKESAMPNKIRRATLVLKVTKYFYRLLKVTKYFYRIGRGDKKCTSLKIYEETTN